MTHIEVLILFTELFHIKNEIDEWFPNGVGSVRIRLKEGVVLPFKIPKVDLIFTADSYENWKLETVESWVKENTYEKN